MIHSAAWATVVTVAVLYGLHGLLASRFGLLMLYLLSGVAWAYMKICVEIIPLATRLTIRNAGLQIYIAYLVAFLWCLKGSRSVLVIVSGAMVQLERFLVRRK